MTRFVRVQDQYATYNVPTKEEYEDYRGKVNQCFERLNAKVEALECITGKKTDVYKVSLVSIANGELELTGTEEQQRAFEISREQIDKSLFPRFLTRDKLVLLALDCGLSVKKIKDK
mgnify:CR=1 FL=1